MSLEAPTLLKPKQKPLGPTTLSRYFARSGVTMVQVADAVGVNKGTISRIAAGGPCSEKLARKIMRVTGLRKVY